MDFPYWCSMVIPYYQFSIHSPVVFLPVLVKSNDCRTARLHRGHAQEDSNARSYSLNATWYDGCELHDVVSCPHRDTAHSYQATHPRTTTS